MTVATEEGWQRLHPLTVLKELGSLAWTLVVLFFLDFEAFDVPGNFAGPEAIAAGVVFSYAVLRYLFTAYRITDQALELRRGVFVKSFQAMPRDRIQAVGTNMSFVGRLLGVTTVEVSAADAEDINLSFVSEEAGEALRRILEAESVDKEPDTPVERETLSSLDPGRLLAFGLTETVLLPAVVLVVGAWVAVFVFRWLFAPLSVVFLLAWPVMSTVRFVGFRSWVEGDRVRAEAGILGRRRSESPLERIQAVQASRPPLRRLFGMETISIVTGDIGVSRDSVQIAGAVAPLEPIGTWRQVSEALIGYVALGEAGLEPSSRRTIRRVVVRGMVALVPVVGAAGAAAVWWSPGWWLPAVVGAAGAVLILAYARARWKVLGWAIDDRHLLVRRGVFIRRLTVVPVHKVQDVTVRATFFQRRLAIATVEVDTAGVMLAGRVMAIDLDETRADDLASRLAAVAARVALPDGV